MAKRTDDDLTPQEKERLKELLKITNERTALAMLALERGEWPGLYKNGTPLPWSKPPPEQEPRP